MRGCMGVDFLHECFVADFDLGVLFWAERPRHHFASDGMHRASNLKHAGKIAGGLSGDGYMRVFLVYESRRHGINVHRVLWAMSNGSWPKVTIDHANCIRTDNRIGNLREATYTEQNANRPAKKNTKVGMKGVCICPSTGRYIAQIHRHGRNHFLGRYDCPLLAHEAYRAAAIKLHAEFARWV